MHLPHQAVLLTAPLPGVPLGEYLAGCEACESRRAVMAAAGDVLARLYSAGLSWPDLRAKHVFVADDGTIGLLDLERLRACRRAAPPPAAAGQVRRFCRELKDAGASDEDLASLLAPLEHKRLEVRG